MALLTALFSYVMLCYVIWAYACLYHCLLPCLYVCQFGRGSTSQQPQCLAMWQLPSRLQFQNWTPRPSTNLPMTCDPSFSTAQSVCVSLCAGNVWIYGTYGKFTTEDPSLVETYCHPTLYWYAFWLTTAGYILLGAFLIGICVCFCCVFLCASLFDG